MSCFARLPDDVLLALASFLTAAVIIYPDQISRLNVYYSLSCTETALCGYPLIPLSMTNRRMRNLCVPTIFRRLIIRHRRDARVSFPDVLTHVQVLTLERQALDYNELAAFLNVATHVREINCDDCYEDTVSHLFGPPSLQRLNLCNVSVPVDTPPIQIRGTLRAFFFINTSRFSTSIWETTLETSPGESSLICSVLAQSHATLESLVLPGESICLSYLASSSWPVLQELVICGVCQTLDVPILKMLSMMPALRFFTWAVVQRKGAIPFLIWPPGTEISPRTDLPIGRLERVVVSWPSPGDLVFSHLGRSLTELSLRDTPRYYRAYIRNSGVYSMPALDCDQALGILHTVPIARLRRLELVFVESGQSDEMALYALLACSCPDLRSFELHRYRSAANIDAPIPVAAIAEALSPMTALEELRLNLDFPEVKRFQPIEVFFFEYMDFLTEQARIFARAMPWLDHLRILHEAVSRWHDWGLWTIRRNSGDSEPVVERRRWLLKNIDMHWL